MRWDYNETLSSDGDEPETAKLRTILEFNLGSLPITADMIREDLPWFNDHKDLYSSAITVRFRALSQAWKRKQAIAWQKEGKRAELMQEIEELQSRNSQAPPEMQNTLEQKRAFLANMEKGLKPERQAKGGVRSKLTVMANFMTTKRPTLPDYSGSDWACMDTVYSLIPPVMSNPEAVGRKKWHWPRKDSVYSPQFLQAFYDIYDSPNTTGSKITGTTISPLSDAEGGWTPPDAKPYLPSDHEFLWQGAQRWMFTPTWLEEHPDAPIVPCNRPTDPEVVRNSVWYKTHSWAISKPGGKKGATKRGRSQSTAASGSTKRDRSYSAAPANDGATHDGEQDGYGHVGKKRRVMENTGFSLSQVDEEDEGQGEEEEEHAYAAPQQFIRDEIPGLTVTARASGSRQAGQTYSGYQPKSVPQAERSRQPGDRFPVPQPETAGDFETIPGSQSQGQGLFLGGLPTDQQQDETIDYDAAGIDFDAIMASLGPINADLGATHDNPSGMANDGDETIPGILNPDTIALF
ncbi:hypothetical protein FFLO_06981 [Filobasidium floriforme]|uniref:Uncharacterized protein n=1 Tax=Filobasidium floriforme TaxID=5210 RepID=A0A8K0NK33_9TREE|nr:hypothetical protein FFLO_06981 [Filobasidium floriforme]